MCSLLPRISMPLSLLVLSGCPLSSPPSATDAATPEATTGAPATEESPTASSLHSTDKEVAPMSDASGVKPIRGPAIPATILRKQILDLIGSLRSVDDLERPHVASLLQVELQKAPGIPERYLYEGHAVEGWEYGVSVARLHGANDSFTTRIGFDNSVEPWTDQRPSYCTMDFEAFAKEIVALGYQREPKRSTLGGKPSWAFTRDAPGRDLVFVVSLSLYYLGEGYPAGQACVNAVKISGGSLNE